MEKETMHPKVQLDVADINHVELNNADEPLCAFHDWSTTAEMTSKDKAVCRIEEQARQRRSDSFSDEWQDHTSEISLSGHQATPQHKSLDLHNNADFDVVDFTALSRTVFLQCFSSNGYTDSCFQEDKFDPHTDQFWKQLVDSVEPSVFDWSCDQAKGYLMTSLQDQRKIISHHSTPRASSPDSDSSYFDWSEDAVCPMLLELRMGNMDLELKNYVYTMQISPIQLEFDHNQAALGLSVLSVEELNVMHEEMTAKFTRLSEELIKELQERDILVRDQEVRNQFVASLMKVEGKKKAVSQAKAQAAANTSSSSKRLVLKAKSTLKKKADSTSDITNQCKFLDTVIPYLQPPNGKWRTKTLHLLIKCKYV